MNLEIPTAPAGVLVLLSFFAPYAIAALNGVLPFVKRSWQRKLVTIVVALLLTAIVFVLYYAITADTIPSWPVLVLLSLVVIATSYALVTKNSATKIEERLSPPIDAGTADGTTAAVITSLPEASAPKFLGGAAFTIGPLPEITSADAGGAPAGTIWQAPDGTLHRVV
ncbi:hypothetical protein [Microbacterium sp. NPDC058389]|uniref:hypothetical protein n=1 Tax=Microbacterium sp. NPDC058389 TaxID=3346475 RepID=UPI00365BF455